MTPKTQFYTATAGTLAIAVCCFTPILVIALGAVGLSALIGYLDIVLLPALVILIVISWLSYRRYVRVKEVRRL